MTLLARGGVVQQPTTNNQQPTTSDNEQAMSDVVDRFFAGTLSPEQQPQPRTPTRPARELRCTTFDSLPDKLKVHLMTEHVDSARDNWERLADAEQLQKVILFYKDEEQAAPAAASPAATRRVPEPWCSPYVPGSGACRQPARRGTRTTSARRVERSGVRMRSRIYIYICICIQ